MINQNNSPFVSIIIVNWNRCNDIISTLSIISNIDYEDKEILVIDNGSTDDSVKEIKERFSSVNLIQLPENIGCEAGNNVGILNAVGDIILFLDSDADIDSENFTKLIDVFKNNPDIGILEPRIIRAHDSVIINEPKSWPLKNTFTGCVVAFRSSVFDKIGLRPAEFFLYSSEPLLALKAVENNIKIVHKTDIIGRHRESPTARANKLFYFYATRNILWLIWRHYPLSSAVYETFFLMFLHAFRSLKHFAFHQFIFGLLTGVFYLRKEAFKKRFVIKSFQEARVFPGYRSSMDILYNKLKYLLKRG